MSKCSTEEHPVWRPSSDIDLRKCDKNFEERFIVRSLQNFPPRPQQQTAITRRKSTTCVCQRCTRSPISSSASAGKRTESGQQMFEHLISKGRKPERLLVPDLATEWFRKQKVFLDKVTAEEKRALQQHPQREESHSLSLACENSHSRLQHSVQYMDYCQELRRRKLLLRRQRHLAREGSPSCRCSDPPNWQQSRKKHDSLDKLEQTEQKSEEHNSSILSHTERNPITVCATQLAGCSAVATTENPPKRRTTAGCSCRTKAADSRLYPHRICSCEQRTRRRNSCSSIFQADGQPMAEECLAALRIKPSLPRLRRRYNLREASQRRLDPGRYRRISPEFYRLLKSYEDGITEKFPLYATPIRYWCKTQPCCTCEVSPNAPAGGNCIEPCLGDQSTATTPDAPVEEEEAQMEPSTTEPRKGSSKVERACDECRDDTCRNSKCESKKMKKIEIPQCTKEECARYECELDCERKETEEENYSDPETGCDNRTCLKRRGKNELTKPLEDSPPAMPDNQLGAVKEPREHAGISKHLELLRSGFSYQPQPYKAPISKRRKPSVEIVEDSVVAEPQKPTAKRKGVLGSLAGLCKRAFFPRRYLLYNNNFQRQAYRTEPEQTHYSNHAIKKPKKLPAWRAKVLAAQLKAKQGNLATDEDEELIEQSPLQPVHNDIRSNEFSAKLDEKVRQYAAKSLPGAVTLTAKDNYRKGMNKAHPDEVRDSRNSENVTGNDQKTQLTNLDKRNEQQTTYSDEWTNQKTSSTSQTAERNDQSDYNRQFIANSSGRNEPIVSNSGRRSDQPTQPREWEDQSSDDRNDQSFAGTDEKHNRLRVASNAQYSSVENEPRLPSLDRRRDQFVGNFDQRNEQPRKWEDQSSAYSNDQSLAYATEKHQKRGISKDHYVKHPSERRDQSIHRSRVSSAYPDERYDQFSDYADERTHQHRAASGGKNEHFKGSSLRKTQQSHSPTGERKQPFAVNFDGWTVQYQTKPAGKTSPTHAKTRLHYYAPHPRMRNPITTAHLSRHSATKREPTNAMIYINRDVVDDTDIVIPKYSQAENTGFYTAYSSLTKINRAGKQTITNRIQKLRKMSTTKREKEKNRAEVSEKISDSNIDMEATKEKKKKSKDKDKRLKTPRVSCRRSFTRVSDFQQVMRLMGRKRVKSPPSKCSTPTSQDRKRQKETPIEATRKGTLKSKPNRSKSPSFSNSTPAQTIKCHKKKSHCRPCNATKLYLNKMQSSHSAVDEKFMNQQRYDHEEDSDRTPSTQFSENSLESFNTELSYQDVDYKDRERYARQWEDAIENRPRMRSIMQEQFNTNPKVAPISPDANWAKTCPTKTWENFSQKFIEVNSRQRRAPMPNRATHSTPQTKLRQRYSARSLKVPSIRMHRRASRETVPEEHPVHMNHIEGHRSSSVSIVSSQSDYSESRHRESMTNDTSMDTVQQREERLGQVIRYTTQEEQKRSSSPSLIPSVFTRKPPLNEKLIRQREANSLLDQTNKPKVYIPKHVRKQISLFTRRPAARLLRSFHQEAALLEQAQRWHRIKRMMKRHESKSQHSTNSTVPKPEPKKVRQPYDRPLEIRSMEQARQSEDTDGHEMVNSRSRSGCDDQFQDRQQVPLKLKLSRGCATPCSSVCNLKCQNQSDSYEQIQVERTDEKSKSQRYQDEALSFIDVQNRMFRQRHHHYAAEKRGKQVEEEEQEDKPEKRKFQNGRNLAAAGYEFVQQATGGREKSAPPHIFHNPFKRKLSKLDGVRAMIPSMATPFRESHRYPDSPLVRDTSLGEELQSSNPEACHRKCHHSGYTNANRTCPAQLSSILKSPSRHFKNSNEGRRVNFVGTNQSNSSMPNNDYHHSIHNGVYTGTCGCSSLTVRPGTRRPSVVHAHTVHSSTEPPIVPDGAHSFTFLNREQSTRAERSIIREIKPQLPSLFAVPVTPTIDPTYESTRVVRSSFDDNTRLPFRRLDDEEAEEVRDVPEHQLPMTSQLLSKRADYRPKRRPHDDRAMPPPVSLVSDLDFRNHFATTRNMTPRELREEGGNNNALDAPSKVITDFMDQVRIKNSVKLLRAEECKQTPKRLASNQLNSLNKWMYPAERSGDLGDNRIQRSPYDCINRAQSAEYYPRRRCYLRRLPEEPLVIGPTHGALREQQILQRALPILFYGRQR